MRKVLMKSLMSLGVMKPQKNEALSTTLNKSVVGPTATLTTTTQPIKTDLFERGLEKFRDNVAKFAGKTTNKEHFEFFKKTSEFANTILERSTYSNDVFLLKTLALSSDLFEFVQKYLLVYVESIQDQGVSEYNKGLLWYYSEIRQKGTVMDSEIRSIFWNIALVLDRVNVYSNFVKFDTTLSKVEMETRNLRVLLSNELFDLSKTFYEAYLPMYRDDANGSDSMFSNFYQVTQECSKFVFVSDTKTIVANPRVIKYNKKFITLYDFSTMIIPIATGLKDSLNGKLDSLQNIYSYMIKSNDRVSYASQLLQAYYDVAHTITAAIKKIFKKK